MPTTAAPAAARPARTHACAHVHADVRRVRQPSYPHAERVAVTQDKPDDAKATCYVVNNGGERLKYTRMPEVPDWLNYSVSASTLT